MEKRIVDLDIAIRSALHHEEPDMTRSISLISELQQLAIQPLMLKKIPNIVMTLRKVRKYIGPVTPHPDPKVCTDISTKQGRKWRVGRVGNCPSRFWKNRRRRREAAARSPHYVLLAHPDLGSYLRP